MSRKETAPGEPGPRSRRGFRGRERRGSAARFDRAFAARFARPRRLAVRVVTGLAALLALLALDDVTTGVEPSLLAEWALIAAASVWFLAVGSSAWKRRRIR